MDSIEEDFMSKVMKRRLGGGNSSCESSPQKQRLKMVRVMPQNESSLNKHSLNDSLKSSGFPNTEHHVEFEGADEIDGFTEDGIHKNSRDIGVTERSTESNEVSDIVENTKYVAHDTGYKLNSTSTDTINFGYKSEFVNKEMPKSTAIRVFDNGESGINSRPEFREYNYTLSDKNIKDDHGKDEHVLPGEKDRKNEFVLSSDNHGKYEYVLPVDDNHVKNIDVLPGDEASSTAGPRIEMFNESDSNSNSNPFILTSFQSLNSNRNINTANLSVKKEAADDSNDISIKNEQFSESSVENFQEFGWSMTKHVHNTKSESVPLKLKDICRDREPGESSDGRNESETSRSDNGVAADEDRAVMKSESQVDFNLKSVLHSERSDYTDKVETVEKNSFKETQDNYFTDERSDKINDKDEEKEKKETGVITEHREKKEIFKAGCKEINTETAESIDSESTYHSEEDVKSKTIRLCHMSGGKEDRSEKCSTKKSRKQYAPRRVRKFEVTADNESTEVFESDEGKYGQTDNVVSCEPLRGQAVGHKKSEKSRKQCKPKRIIDQLQSIDDHNTVLSKDTEETESDNNDNDINNDRGSKYDCLIKQENEVFNVKNENEGLSKWDVSLTEPNEVSENIDEIQHKSAVNCTSKSEDIFETGKTICNSESTWQNAMNESNGNPFASLNTSPFYYGLSPNLDLISNLTPGLLQGATASTGNFALNENGPENLEVIRQLREIRCNRYRKISMAEKREIAGYASTHGVSQAAAYYNVSKSAVSMWTKLDFSNVDEDAGKQKKNCMIGNEKFEALCQKVKKERENKFKGMTKQDKFEVSRYAKLVGVREMARCLDVALGTVSGWMRQFPYKVEIESSDAQLSDESNTKSSNQNKNTNEMAENKKMEEESSKSNKRKKSDVNVKGGKKKKRKSKADELETDLYKTVQKDNTIYILPIGSSEQNDIELLKDGNEATEETMETAEPECENNLDESLQQKDELDKMIAETWQKPDFQKCFEDIKDMIKDSPLEGDEFFRSLFERVIACRADKYKTLKPSEKLEVVRYAKRVGVRKVAKILGLATGTLSGWNTKYQSSLGITDPNIDMSNKSDLLVSYLSPDRNSESADSSSASQNFTVTPGACLDNSEKSEVTAVKLLFKDKFPVLLEKIGIAKQVKFRNITTDEKIELVKCSKLVGIRPTARVFNIPIGTLSGWITKYTKTLHPAYHVDIDHDASSNSQDAPSQFSPMGIYNPNVIGRTAAPAQMFQGLMNVNPVWQPVPGLTSGGQGPSLNLFPQFPNMPTSSSSLTSSSSSSLPVPSPASSELFSSPFFTSKNASENIEQSRETGIDKEIESEKNRHLVTTATNLNDYQSNNSKEKWNSSETENQSKLSAVSKPEETVSQSAGGGDFENEAKVIAQQYLTAAYERMGIPIV